MILYTFHNTMKLVAIPIAIASYQYRVYFVAVAT